LFSIVAYLAFTTDLDQLKQTAEPWVKGLLSIDEMEGQLIWLRILGDGVIHQRYLMTSTLLSLRTSYY